MSGKPVQQQESCYDCDSTYKITFWENETNGFPKFCPFCGGVKEEESDDDIPDIDKESLYDE